MSASLLDEADHRVRLGHRIADGVSLDHDTGHENDSMSVSRPQETATVDGDHAIGAPSTRSSTRSRSRSEGPAMAGTVVAATKTPDMFGSAPSAVPAQSLTDRGVLPLCQEVWNREYEMQTGNSRLSARGRVEGFGASANSEIRKGWRELGE